MSVRLHLVAEDATPHHILMTFSISRRPPRSAALYVVHDSLRCWYGRWRLEYKRSERLALLQYLPVLVQNHMLALQPATGRGLIGVVPVIKEIWLAVLDPEVPAF